MLNNTESLKVMQYPSMEEAKKAVYLRDVFGITQGIVNVEVFSG